MFKRVLFLLFIVVVSSVSAFAPPATSVSIRTQQQASPTELLAGRRWNFNEGRSPWGMKRNAEIWNGRMAQMAFTITMIQELVQGKGVVQGMQQGDPINYAFFGLFVVSTVGLTAWLAIKGDDDFTVDV
mmetsp:Transcript_14523/g.24070  ORF Transcript_14523/g.24070 Transcript_14523/m.24070 type:complete len:129 (+) Transcript_14523:92-478(+)|eukprot:CAMPEP_0119007878 /NCGR_PEP_ID=MMETSP1176-20130426/3312_1 /TAXON_ID=265551 /ORGANISM="Synedropsis recta cf, Strain CCMP1620" /LENGTH=128 /DNA_ID=CAMNT_0006960111 /DNA_START=90 /DNA_END=476 /DNA_ORIENTATION=-